MIQTPLDKTAFIPFSNLIVDTQDLYRMVNDLTTVQRSLFKDKEGTISDKSKDFLASSLTNVFVEVEKRGLEPAGDAKQQEFVKTLIEYLKNLSVVKITLAFGPTTNFLQRINTEISNEIGNKAVLDIVVNQFIIGGAVFEYNGKVRAYTLEEKLDTAVIALIKSEGTISRKSEVSH